MNKKLSDILKFIVFLGIGFLFIYCFLLKLDPEQKAAIWQSFLSANYMWVGVAMLVCLLSHFFRALRWQLLFKPLSYSPGLNNTFGSVIVAYMANLAFPRLGEVLRCAVLRTSDRIPIEKSLGTVVTERVTDVGINMLIFLFGLFFMVEELRDWLYDSMMTKFSSLPSIPMLLGICAGLLIVAFVLYRLFWKKLLRYSFFKKINDLAVGCIDGVKSVFHLGARRAILYFVYSFLIYAFYVLGGLVIFRAFPETQVLGFKAAFVFYLFGSVGMMFSQGGIGVYPKLVQMSLAIYGISLEVGTAAGWLLWGSQQVVIIVTGLIYLIYFSLIKKQNQE